MISLEKNENYSNAIDDFAFKIFNSVIDKGAAVFYAPVTDARHAVLDRLREVFFVNSIIGLKPHFTSWIGNSLWDVLVSSAPHPSGEYSAFAETLTAFSKGNRKDNVLIIDGIDNLTKIVPDDHGNDIERAYTDDEIAILASDFLKFPHYSKHSSGSIKELPERIIIVTSDDRLVFALREFYNIIDGTTKLPECHKCFLDVFDDDERYILGLFSIAPYRYYSERILLGKRDAFPRFGIFGDRYKSVFNRLVVSKKLQHYYNHENSALYWLAPSMTEYAKQNGFFNIARVFEDNEIGDRAINDFTSGAMDGCSGMALYALVLDHILCKLELFNKVHEKYSEYSLKLSMLICQVATLFRRRVRMDEFDPGAHDTSAIQANIRSLNRAAFWVEQAQKIINETVVVYYGSHERQNHLFTESVIDCVRGELLCTAGKYSEFVGKNVIRDKIIADKAVYIARVLFDERVTGENDISRYDSRNPATLFSLATELLKKSIEIKKTLSERYIPNLQRHIAKTSLGLADALNAIEMHRFALRYIYTALDTFFDIEEKSGGSEAAGIADAYEKASDTYFKLDDTSRAVSYLVKCEHALTCLQNSVPYNRETECGKGTGYPLVSRPSIFISSHKHNYNGYKTDENPYIIKKLAELKRKLAMAYAQGMEYGRAYNVLRLGKDMLLEWYESDKENAPDVEAFDACLEYIRENAI